MIFKEVGIWLLTIGKKMRESVSGYSRISKLKRQIAAEQNELYDYYMEIGEAYYREHADADSDPYRESINDINIIFSKIAELKREIAAIRNLKICPNCGVETAFDNLFCPKCGRPFSLQNAMGMTNRNPPGPNYEAFLDGAVFYEFSERPVKEKESSDEHPIQEKSPSSICAKCGAELPPMSVFCAECGTPVLAAHDDDDETEQDESIIDDEITK